MTFEIIKGDLFDPTHNFDALAQGVNTFGIMGAGIAVKFREDYPEMYEDYKNMCEKYGESLTGLLHIWSTIGSTEFLVRTAEHGDGPIPLFLTTPDKTIYNMFSQRSPGKDGNYNYLLKSAILVRQDAEAQGFASVGLPWIGCGIAGLAKHNVEHILRTVFADSRVDFVLVEQ